MIVVVILQVLLGCGVIQLVHEGVLLTEDRIIFAFHYVNGDVAALVGYVLYVGKDGLIANAVDRIAQIVDHSVYMSGIQFLYEVIYYFLKRFYLCCQGGALGLVCARSYVHDLVN